MNASLHSPLSVGLFWHATAPLPVALRDEPHDGGSHKGIEFAACKREHEFFFQSEFNDKSFVALGCPPCLKNRPLLRQKFGIREVGHKLTAQKWAVV